MRSLLAQALFAILVVAGAVHAGGLSVDWYTVDGGGAMQTSGGGFELSGTIGQPDAGSPLRGGDFELIGGFWGAAAPVCRCPADMNGDGRRDARDIQTFIGCIVSPGSGCACADVDGVRGLDLDDVQSFVDSLLEGEPCP